jgi:two-component system KDP operon response regulator KdpE
MTRYGFGRILTSSSFTMTFNPDSSMTIPEYPRRGLDLLDSRHGQSNGHPVPTLRIAPIHEQAGLSCPSFTNVVRVLNHPPPPNPVLLIMADAEIRGLLRNGLEWQGFHLLEAATGREGIALAQQHRLGAVLIDLDIIDGGVLGVISELRELSRIPILALAGRVNRVGAVDALDHGASDFLARPLNLEELSARLRAFQRDSPPPSPEIFQSGSLSVDLARRIVRVEGRLVRLSATEFSLLRLFVRHAGAALTHAQILQEVWGSEMLDKKSYLRVYLNALRAKLENPPEPALFQTEPAVGYRLVVREP